MKQLIVFDLDGTLAESKAAIDNEMAARLSALLSLVNVAIISGGDWPQFETQILSHLPQDHRLKRLSILPTCGTKFFRYDEVWKKLYSEDFTDAEVKQVTDSLQQTLDTSDIKVEKVWGDQIENRGSQITFSALGQHAPLRAKKDWDPDYAKRQTIKTILDTLLPEFSVRMGGATSIDVTKPGIDKAYGIRKLRDVLGIAIDDMLFVGDALFPGGNDYPAKQAGATSIRVRDPEETKRVCEAVIACLPAIGHTKELGG